MARDVPAVLDEFQESPDHVDFYTNASLHQETDKVLLDQLEYTSFTEYWGRAMYLRRLLEDQTTELVSTIGRAIEDSSKEARSTVVQVSGKIDYSDPFFWRETATSYGLNANSTASNSDVEAYWTMLAESINVTVDALQAYAANVSGLTIQQLNRVPYPADYLVKSTIKSIDAVGFEASRLGLQSGNRVKQSLVSKDNFVVFGALNGSCLEHKNGIVFTLPSVPDDPDISTRFTPRVAYRSDDPFQGIVEGHPMFNLTAEGIVSPGDRVFFFSDFDDAEKASCDPTEAYQARRRLQSHRAGAIIPPHPPTDLPHPHICVGPSRKCLADGVRGFVGR